CWPTPAQAARLTSASMSTRAPALLSCSTRSPAATWMSRRSTASSCTARTSRACTASCPCSSRCVACARGRRPHLVGLIQCAPAPAPRAVMARAARRPCLTTLHLLLVIGLDGPALILALAACLTSGIALFLLLRVARRVLHAAIADRAELAGVV